jgi:SHS2 domain-containing protein
MPYRFLAHTADLRVGVSGAGLAAIYQSAADLVRETLVGDSAVAAGEERRFAVAGADDAERFFRFVRELLYLYDSEGFLPARVRAAPGAGGAGGEATVAGERFDPARHAAERQVKALTRHGYRFERTPAGYEAELLFDL